jgi:glucokinase-like ROK family protein
MPANHADMRNMNRSTVIEQIKKEKLLSRSDIAANTGLNRATVSSIVDDLIRDGIVIEANLQDSKGGRPGKNLKLNAQGGYVIGIDIEVGFISIIATDLTAQVLFKREIPLTPPQTFIEIMSQAEKLIDEALAHGHALNIRPIGIGVAIPGTVDSKEGRVALAPNLGWKDIQLRLILAQRFGLPIYVENDANYGAFGEYYFGSGKACSSLIYISTGIGLGGGIILDGKLFEGADGYAGEIGHTVIDLNGQLCACGKHGCWETFVNEIAICQYIKDQVAASQSASMLAYCSGSLDKLTFGNIVSAARQGEPVAVDTLEHLGYFLGLGIANMVNIFNPEMVVIGGVYSTAYPLMKATIEQTVVENILKPLSKTVKVLPAECGTEAVLMGAVATVIEARLRATTYG